MGASKILAGAMLGFIGGILMASYFGFASFLVLLALAFGIGCLALWPGRFGMTFLLASLFFSVGLVLFHRAESRWANFPEQMSYQGTVRILTVGENKVFYRPVTLESISCGERCPKTRILYRAPITFEAEPGDAYSFTCELSRPKNFDEQFDYRSYLATQDIGYVCEKKGNATFLERPSLSTRRTLFRIRERVTESVRRALPEPEAGLSLGLILGGNDFLGKETQTMFANTGLSHIVAVSGYNMTILVQFCLILGLAFGLSRKPALIVSAFFIFFFLILVGAPASAVRAALMTGAGFIAFFFGRLPASYNALLLAAVLMLAFNPLLLRFDVGFQLSFLATLAILAGGPLIEMYLPLGRVWAKILALLLFTIIIELFTLPVLFTTFGQVTWLAPVTNLLILPLVPVAMILSAILLPGFLLFPAFSPLIAFPLWTVLTLQVNLVEWFAALPFGLIHFRNPGVMGALLWYGALGILVYWLHRKKKNYVLGMAH
ncbi:MAG: ComEC/Rec2 family competence protein [Candidatus Moraniibacteriota bacterium]